MPITQLEPTHDVFEPDVFGQDHPIRKVTRQIAFDGAWDAERAAKVADLFDSMSADWTSDHDVKGRYAPLEDALTRGAPARGRCVELGSGTGLGTRILADHFANVTAVDLAFGMLTHAPADYGSRVQGDSSALPLASGTVDVCVLVNMFLFPDELNRVLTPSGSLVWVNTMGAQTPIHLSADDIDQALPGNWNGLASRSGYGTWSVHTRA